MIYFLMTSLGELATHNPTSGAFFTYGTKYVEGGFGFALGWNYWYNWAITVAFELVAVQFIMKFWFPEIPGCNCFAALLIILGLFPAVAGVIQAVPQAVLGGAVMVMFGAVAASGINILSGVVLDRRALLIIAIFLGLGLGVAQVPQILEHLPELFRNIFSSGVATGGIAALILNIVLPETKK